VTLVTKRQIVFCGGTSRSCREADYGDGMEDRILL
jgi:hypothetical protein